MKASPTVSIGIPVYNGETFLEETLVSIVGQDFEDFEVIISDNGSTDRTEEICRRWAGLDPRIQYHRSDANRGASWNYNRVFREARGRYFKWAADDDTLAPSWLKECVSVLDQSPHVVIAYTRVVEVNENGEVIEYWSKYPSAISKDPIERFRGVLVDSRCLPVFGLIRREALAKTGLIRPHDSSDRVLLGELSFLGSFHRIEKDLFYHREHAQRSMRAFDSQQDRGAWFDPKNTNPLTYWPNWRYYLSFFGVALRSPVGASTKMRAAAALGRRMITSRKLLLADLVAAVRAATHRLGRGSSG